MRGAADCCLAVSASSVAAAAKRQTAALTQDWPLGAVRAVQQPELSRSFTLTNGTGAALSGLRLQASSPGALRVLGRLTGSKLASTPLPDGSRLPDLAPRQGFVLTVTLRLTRLQPGPIRQQVNVTAAGQPWARIRITGALLPEVEFTPPVLAFGPGPPGTERTREFTVSLDPLLAAPGSTPMLYCSDPDVTLQPIPLLAGMARKSLLLTPAQRTAGLYSVRATLSGDASLGRVAGSVMVAAVSLPAGPLPRDYPSPALAYDALHSASLPLAGSVDGDVSAEPPTVYLGVVQRGKEAEQRILMRLKKPGALDGAQITTACPWLAARLERTPGPGEFRVGGGGHDPSPTPDGRADVYGHTPTSTAPHDPSLTPGTGPLDLAAPASSLIGRGRGRSIHPSRPPRQKAAGTGGGDHVVPLTVLLIGDPPAGPFRSELTLTLRNGQRLVIPVGAAILGR